MGNGKKYQWIAWIKWLFSRTGLVYVLLALLIVSVTDVPTIWGNARMRALNRLMPLFDDFAGVVVDGRELTLEQWETYTHYYKFLTKMLPENSGPYLFLGFCKANTEEGDGVIDLLSTAEEFSPGIFWIDYNLGIALYNAGRYEEAVGYFEQAVTDQPNVMQLYMSETVLFRQILAKANHLNHDFHVSFIKALSRAYLLTAKSAYAMKNYDKALMVVYSALSLNLGNHQDFYRLASRVLTQRGQLWEAVDILQVGLERYPMDIDILNELSNILKIVSAHEQLRNVSIMLRIVKRQGFRPRDLFSPEKLQLF